MDNASYNFQEEVSERRREATDALEAQRKALKDAINLAFMKFPRNPNNRMAPIDVALGRARDVMGEYAALDRRYLIQAGVRLIEANDDNDLAGMQGLVEEYLEPLAKVMEAL